MVKVLAINSSPNMNKGNTDMLLTPFIEGMTGAGAEVELLYTKKLKINPCQGEYACVMKTPGKCFQNDDMQMLIPKLGEADIWVFASPVYWENIPGPMKNLIDRTVPLMFPALELRDGHCRYPVREGVKHGKLVLISTCGWWEMDNFDLLISQMKGLCKNLEREFAGALLRPHGALKQMVEMGMPLDDIFEAAKDAGRQLVEEDKISTENLTTISRELVTLEMFVEFAKQEAQRMMEEAEGK